MNDLMIVKNSGKPYRHSFDIRIRKNKMTYMKWTSILAFLLLPSIAFTQNRQGITYDFDCIRGSITEIMIDESSQAEEKAVKAVGAPVTISEEIQAGNETLAEMQKKWKFINTGTSYANLNSLLQKLVASIYKPRGFKYSVYLIDTSMINAFTIGGKIFVTTAIYNFCRNNDEIACVLGHEISHNELGHINLGIKRLKTAGKLGTPGYLAAALGKILTISFNQRNETHCDFIGVDLAVAAGFNACKAIELWNRMKANEDKYNSLTSFFSSHPHSEKRAACIRQHLSTNYSLQCPR